MAAGRRTDLRADPLHLVRRFAGSLRAKPLTPTDQSEVAALLRPAERATFWAQSNADQRHGLQSARAALETAPGRIDLARAALLHDIGKLHARIGPFRRSLATFLEILGVPTLGGLRNYLDHAGLGADDLAGLGAEALVVDFAQHHHGQRPPTIEAQDWAILQNADTR